MIYKEDRHVALTALSAVNATWRRDGKISYLEYLSARQEHLEAEIKYSRSHAQNAGRNCQTDDEDDGTDGYWTDDDDGMDGYWTDDDDGTDGQRTDDGDGTGDGTDTKRTDRTTTATTGRTATTGHDGADGQRTDDHDGTDDGTDGRTDGQRTTAATTGWTRRDGRTIYIALWF